MSEQTYAFDYFPTTKEILAGLTAIRRSVYRDVRWWVLHTFGVFAGLAYGVFSLAVAIMILNAMGWSTSQLAISYYLIALVIGWFFILTPRLLRKKLAQKSVDKFVNHEYRMTLGKDGIEMDSNNVSSRRRWLSLNDILETKFAITLVDGNVGIVLSDRILQTAGDPEAIRRDFRNWYDSAHAQVQL